MLRVIAPAEATACSITVDGYVPLIWHCAGAPVPLYWRTGDLTRALLEIGLVPESGVLTKVAVISAKGCLRPDDGVTAAHMAAASSHDGLPRCDTTPGSTAMLGQTCGRGSAARKHGCSSIRGRERYIDEDGSFTITVGAGGVSLWLGDHVPLTDCYVTPALCCGVGTAGDLRLLRFRGLRDDECAVMVATIIAEQARSCHHDSEEFEYIFP